MFFKRKNKKKAEFIPQYKYGQIIEAIATDSDYKYGRFYVVGKIIKEEEDYVFILETTEQKHFNKDYVIAIEKENICKNQKKLIVFI
jgi:hypothetical protein